MIDLCSVFENSISSITVVSDDVYNKTRAI